VLPETTRIGRVRLRVASHEKSLSFYGSLLGLKGRALASGQVALTAGDDRDALLELIEQPGAHQQPVRAAGLYHTAFLLPSRADLGHALRRLSEARYPLQGGSDHGVSEALYLADPDGNGVEIYADRARERWPRSNGEIAMSTMPLDVESLLLEADSSESKSNSPWEGFPEGSTVGHVHLRVPSIEAARKLLVDTIGFDVISARYSGAIFVSAGGYHHHVAANIWEGANVPPLPDDASGLLDFEVIVPDAEEIQMIAERARSAGLPVEAVVSGIAVEHGGIRVHLVNRSG
jgi:catechol 2,3-dioxygenase